MVHLWEASICQTKPLEWVEKSYLETTMHQKISVVKVEILAREKAKGDQRMMSMEEISSVNSVIRRILAIPPYILI